MNIENIKNLIAQGESKNLEFKKSTSLLKQVAETLCGFLNGNGGIALIGVKNNGELIGQDVTDQTRLEIANLLHKFEPTAPIHIHYIKLPGETKYVIVLEAIANRQNIPYTFNGRPYQRTESETSIMPQSRYQQLIIERLHANYSWEKLPASNYSIEQLDQNQILRVIRLGIEAGRLPEAAAHDSIKDALLRLELFENNNGLINAAIILFGTKMLPHYPQCELRMARFRGNDKTEFLDSRQIQGHAFYLLEEAMLFVTRHIPIAAKIVSTQMERIEKPLYPINAVREALVNALCHRDYSFPGGAISLAIFDNRMEIWSEGLLPPGMTLSQLKITHASKPRNPIIANVFHRCNLIEKWGRGTQQIIESCLNAGLLAPEFFEQAGAFCVQFKSSAVKPLAENKRKLTARQQEIIAILKAGQQKVRDIQAQLKQAPAPRTLRDDLHRLKELGIIDFQGHTHNVTWFLKNEAD